MRGRRRAQAPEVDEDDPESIRQYNQWYSSNMYNAYNREERNRKKQERMATLRAAQALEPTEAVEARKVAARESARQYRERNREFLARKARSRRAVLKARKDRAAAVERRRLDRQSQVELAALPKAIPQIRSNTRPTGCQAGHRTEDFVGDSEGEDGGLPDRPQPGQKMFLVCGRNVKAPGYYVSWPSADFQYKRVSGASLKGYYDFSSLRDAWHARCDLGEHAHPPGPAIGASGASVPRTPARQTAVPRSPAATASPPSTPVRVVYISDSPSPSPESSPGAPPSYTSSPAPLRSPSASPAPPIGLLCYAIRVGEEAETFTDASEARARFLELQNAGLSPACISAPSVARCLAWMAGTNLSAEGRVWEEEENRARRRRVAMQHQRGNVRQTVLYALATVRRDGGDDSGDESDTSRTTDDLASELRAREAFGASWRAFIEL
ncbi:hypothetical protein C8R47DRAFT_1225619 [Mycena vitilis]|nr:hypothetical protein C8R47DRAFT_1225619 [Mycena vitilis]